MDNYIIALYPDCNKDLYKCFERYVRDRVQHMKDFGLSSLKIGTFSDTFDEQFKSIEKDHKGSFWWQPHSWNVGTVKDRYVYSFVLYMKNKELECLVGLVKTASDKLIESMQAPPAPVVQKTTTTSVGCQTTPEVVGELKRTSLPKWYLDLLADTKLDDEAEKKHKNAMRKVHEQMRNRNARIMAKEYWKKIHQELEEKKKACQHKIAFEKVHKELRKRRFNSVLSTVEEEEEEDGFTKVERK